MKILMIGDIFAKTGRNAIKTELKKIKQNYEIDFVVANAENATHCKGLNIKHYKDLMEAGIDFFTMGNHTWSKREVMEILDNKNNIIRPYNIISSHEFAKHGVGTRIINFKNKKIQITNLIGSSVHFNELQTNPFLALEEILKQNNNKPDIHIVDFHAETTSEKNALFAAFKSKVTIIVGTHTHVQTNDARIRDNTAYITDLGMTGPADGVIGAKSEDIIAKFLNKTIRFNLEEAQGKYQFCAALIEVNNQTNLPTKIEPIYIFEK